MSRSRRLIAILGAICFIVSAPAALADTQRVLSVSGHGEAAGVPDQGQLSVGVTTVARTAADDRAQTYARVAGVKLGAILAISDSETQVSPPVPMLRAMAVNKLEGTPVAEGEQTVSANVNITWEIL